MHLRQAGTGDAAAIAALYAPYVRDTTISFELDPPPPEEMAARMARVAESGLPWIVAETAEGGIAGYAYAGRFHARAAYRFTVETAIYLDEAQQGRGLGSLLYERLIAILTELGYAQAIALVTLPNGPSEVLHRRSGFEPTGTYRRAGFKQGRWIDVGLFQRALAPMDAPPATEPLPLAQSPSWRALAP